MHPCSRQEQEPWLANALYHLLTKGGLLAWPVLPFHEWRTPPPLLILPPIFGKLRLCSHQEHQRNEKTTQHHHIMAKYTHGSLTSTTCRSLHSIWTAASLMRGTGTCKVRAAMHPCTSISETLHDLDAWHRNLQGPCRNASMHKHVRNSA